MNNRVSLIDNMEYMKTIPDNYFELIIADPEYGINAAGNKKSRNRPIKHAKGYTSPAIDYKYKIKDWDKSPPTKEYFKEIFRISKNQIVFGVNYFTNLYDFGSGRIFWDKVNGDSSYSDGELAYCSYHDSTRIVKFMWNGMLQGKSVKEGNTQQGNKSKNEVRIHPTQKPVALYKWLLKNYAKPNDKIFDSHAGSGSIRIACHDMGFDFTGCEIDKDYWNDQEARFKKHIQQGDLFTGAELQKSIFSEVI